MSRFYKTSVFSTVLLIACDLWAEPGPRRSAIIAKSDPLTVYLTGAGTNDADNPIDGFYFYDGRYYDGHREFARFGNPFPASEVTVSAYIRWSNTTGYWTVLTQFTTEAATRRYVTRKLPADWTNLGGGQPSIASGADPAPTGTFAAASGTFQRGPLPIERLLADTSAPTLASAAVDSTGHIITVTFVDDSFPLFIPNTGASGFTVNIGAVTATISAISPQSKNRIVITVADTIISSDTVTLDYNTAGNVVDGAYPTPIALATITASSVTNNSSATPTSMLNAEKLSLPLNTLVGTKVSVSDWVAAGLSSQVQQLAAPSSAITGEFVQGADTTEVNAVYTKRGTSGGKDYYNQLGQSDSTTTYSIVWGALGGILGTGWGINGAGAVLDYYSTDAVSRPDQVTTWISANLDQVPTVTSVTTGALNAGATVSSAIGVPTGSRFIVQGSLHGYNLYSGIGVAIGFYLVPTNGDDPPNIRWKVRDNPDNDTGASFAAASGGNIAFPWDADWSADGATVTRDDVAAETSWVAYP